MHEWYTRQVAAVRAAANVPQLGLDFGGRVDHKARAVAALDLPFGSSGHPSDAPNALLEEYLDLVASGEMDATQASIMLMQEQAYGTLGDSDDEDELAEEEDVYELTAAAA